jgi:hypothetical protein
MEYLHMQKPKPADATGVPVKVTAIDPSGKSIDIGTAVSDDGGSFGVTFTPTLEGKYQIKATFDGTDSYGSSYATTYLVVGAATPAPSATSPPTSPSSTPPPTTASPSPIITAAPTPPGEGIPTETLIIAAVAVVIIAAAAAAAVILRRRR